MSTRANHGSYFHNYIQQTQTYMKTEIRKENNKELKQEKELIEEKEKRERNKNNKKRR